MVTHRRDAENAEKIYKLCILCASVVRYHSSNLYKSKSRGTPKTVQPIENLQTLKQQLDTLQLNYEIIEHRPITTVEEGLQELGIDAADGVSTLILYADGNYVSIIRRDDKKLSFKKIKKLLKAHDLKFAAREQVIQLTNCDLGYVSLFNPGFHPLLDATILARPFVYGGTGSPEHDLKIRPADLVQLTGAQVADITD